MAVVANCAKGNYSLRNSRPFAQAPVNHERLLSPVVQAVADFDI